MSNIHHPWLCLKAQRLQFQAYRVVSDVSSEKFLRSFDKSKTLRRNADDYDRIELKKCGILKVVQFHAPNKHKEPNNEDTEIRHSWND